MSKFSKTKIVCILLCLALLFHVTGCGTILHPERVGQPKTDVLDGSIVILDSLLLLLFIIPGIVAFIVDFGNNTIYLPQDQISQLPEGVVLSEANINELREKLQKAQQSTK